MLGVIIATHGDFANGLIDSLDMIVGKQKNVIGLSLKKGQDINEYGKLLEQAILKLNTKKGVVVLTDLFGASPFNQAALISKNLKKHDLKVITGVNLPMVIEAVNQAMVGNSAEDAVVSIKSSAIEGIRNLDNILN